MEKFIWTSEYSLGISIIDEQHQHFFEIMNQIYDLLEKNPNDKESLLKIVKELTDYAFYHLATEEKYFTQFTYSDLENHMKYHTQFRIKTGEYSERIKNGKEDLPKLILEITDFAKNWLTKHILIADKMYAPLFKAHGLN
jgi:hemerythrin-like metal-binding protein